MAVRARRHPDAEHGENNTYLTWQIDLFPLPVISLKS